MHDIFGFPYAAVGETVGRSTAACRQLASRARRAIRESSDGRRDDIRRADIENEQHRAVSERFIEACAAGDVSALMEVLDPDGDAVGVPPDAFDRPGGSATSAAGSPPTETPNRPMFDRASRTGGSARTVGQRT